jgi:hypothetical protein
MFTLVNWTRDLKVEFDAAVESCGSADLVNNHFAPFLNAILSHVPAVFNPVKTARETFATLTQQVANRKGKQLISALVAHAAPSASALTSPQQPGGTGSGNGGGGKTGGKGGGNGSSSYPVIPGPGPPGSFWHFGHKAFVRYVEDANGRRQTHVCMMCGWAGSPSHDAGNCPSDSTDVTAWVHQAIPVQ